MFRNIEVRNVRLGPLVIKMLTKRFSTCHHSASTSENYVRQGAELLRLCFLPKSPMSLIQ